MLGDVADAFSFFNFFFQSLVLLFKIIRTLGELVSLEFLVLEL